MNRRTRHPIRVAFPAACALAATLWLAAAPAQADEAGRCHFHGSKPAAEATVLACARQRRDALIAGGKLDRSWRQVGHDRIETVEGKKGKEWKVSYRNPAAADAAKGTLYLFFTLPGNFIAANFTGQ